MEIWFDFIIDLENDRVFDDIQHKWEIGQSDRENVHSPANLPSRKEQVLLYSGPSKTWTSFAQVRKADLVHRYRYSPAPELIKQPAFPAEVHF